MNLPSVSLPAGYPRIRVVETFDEWLAAPFSDGINAVCWPRELSGDFAEVVRQLGSIDGIAPLSADRLRSLPLTAAGREAVEVMLADEARLRAAGLAPELNAISAYPQDEEEPQAPTHVYSFHADSAPIAAETILCTYAGAPSEGLRNDEARRRIDDPEIRADLLRRFGGADDDDFRAHLAETCQDLHYVPLAGARPFSFGLGHLWRIAVQSPDCPVPPCIHRAPEERGAGRLLLIA